MVAREPSAEKASAIAKTAAPALLRWYDANRRHLPWRSDGMTKPDPYRVWLSEIMLQQTTVRTVIPYYGAFTTRFPTLKHLAEAPLESVLQSWAGLGYYSRGRNLHACAIRVLNDFGGVFPADEAVLRTLPGIGPYTAAAIAAIAFNQRTIVIDGNVERVLSRLFCVEEPLPKAKPLFHTLADTITPSKRPGDFAQAMMDLGATICTPRSPACERCPLASLCTARQAGTMERYPLKAPKAKQVNRFGAAFLATRPDGAVLLRTRPEKGLLGGMTEVPTTDFTLESKPADHARSAPLAVNWRKHPVPVEHVFTHFRLALTVYAASVPAETPAPAGMRWTPRSRLAAEALPTLFHKVLAHPPK